MPRKSLDAYDVNIGRQIRKLRLATGKTQEEVGKVINITKATMSAIELGAQRLNFWEADQLAKLFGVSTESFRNL
jgi:DNA-binding XRE family transcriptional regulator